MKQFILHKQGGPKNLKLETFSDNFKPKSNEVAIRHTAIGVNYFDIHFRSGDFIVDKLPAILGTEAAGIIEEVGSKVTNYKSGDRVAYVTGPIGAYTQKRVINSNLLIKIPSYISDVIAAGSLLKGMMAHTLLNRVYIAKNSKRILVHAATGGVGQFLCAFAANMGLKVIGTVGHDKKIPLAKKFGCHHVINYKTQDFTQEVEKITNGAGVGIVYDGVGKDTFIKSLACLYPMGMCVSFGEVSGKVPPFDINYLMLNSLYLTKPVFALYKASRVELALTAAEIFAIIKEGIIEPRITTYAFKDLPKVHEKMQKRLTAGSQVLVFNK